VTHESDAAVPSSSRWSVESAVATAVESSAARNVVRARLCRRGSGGSACELEKRSSSRLRACDLEEQSSRRRRTARSRTGLDAPEHDDEQVVLGDDCEAVHDGARSADSPRGARVDQGEARRTMLVHRRGGCWTALVDDRVAAGRLVRVDRVHRCAGVVDLVLERLDVVDLAGRRSRWWDERGVGQYCGLGGRRALRSHRAASGELGERGARVRGRKRSAGEAELAARFQRCRTPADGSTARPSLHLAPLLKSLVIAIRKLVRNSHLYSARRALRAGSSSLSAAKVWVWGYSASRDST